MMDTQKGFRGSEPPITVSNVYKVDHDDAIWTFNVELKNTNSGEACKFEITVMDGYSTYASKLKSKEWRCEIISKGSYISESFYYGARI